MKTWKESSWKDATWKVSLIANWKTAWKYVSVQLAALLALGSLAFDYLPFMKDYLPQEIVTYLALAIIAARLVSQPKRIAEEVEAKHDGAVDTVEVKIT